MNPTTADPAPPPPPPPQPPRSSFSCDRHPEEQFTGFCPSCLCERLTTLDQSSSNPSSSRRPSTSSSSAAAAIKALFSSSKPSTSFPANNTANPPPPKPSKPSSFLPELRRTKSFSASKHEGLGLNFSGAFEPQRKSCDVRVRNTLWSLFSQDDESKNTSSKPSTSSTNLHPISKDIGDSFVNGPVLESKEEDDEEDEPDIQESEISHSSNNDNGSDEITPVVEEIRAEERGDISLEIVEEEEGLDFSAIKPMKDHIDLDSQAKKSSGGGMDLKEIAGSFWSAASVFSKKWRNWRQKQKLKKRNNGENSSSLPVEKPISRHYRETQSEIADYGFGRRSCDTDPRFSLDAGRMSFDDPRYSFDEPRASWDGYLIGRSFPRMPPMVSVVEDAPVAHVARSDTQIPVEEPAIPMNYINGDENMPGGSAQTREYYSDSSSRRRKSLDRSSSIRKTAAAVVAEIDEMKSVSNAKVLPATTDYVNGAKALVGEKDTRDTNSNSNSLRDDCSETFELGGFRDNASVVGNGERKGSKKSWRWTWNLWGFIHRRSTGNKYEDEDRYSRANGVERSFSESWPELRHGNGELRGGLNRKVFRSNSSVSWRHSNNMGVSFGSVRKLGMEMNGHGKKKRDEFILERNRSARYSPNNVDNGLLRFYLTPLRGSRRGGPAAKARLNNSHSIARSVLRLY
ncbi:hypothetical protein M9H77_22973 [Catharanthus roseus]|uniref:Uncharacterized protein n=1 Tax=Catharanthus roseus TaxID=4058 RepID=A0ACC0ATQ2_CATRO|nr:hypothetical protein M9H77_22973 [Catharanthus roseus]